MPSDVNSAQVVVNRQSALSNALLTWAVWIDGQKAGTVASGASLTVEVMPGRHTITIAIPFSFRSEPFAFDVEPSARMDLVTRPSVTGRPKIWRESGSSTTRVVRLSREWSRTCTVDVEHATTEHGSAGLGLHLLDLKVEAERTLSKTYSTSSEERETFEEEVTLNIHPHTRSEIVFSWKEIRQKGAIQLAGEGLDVRFPYEAVVGLTFDQQQIDS